MGTILVGMVIGAILSAIFNQPALAVVLFVLTMILNTASERSIKP